MKMPNGYGAVIKLSGKRRKPYAVRITIGFKLAGPEDQPHAVQQYRYLEYFEKRADAVRYLSDYNAGIKVREHVALADIPTFKDIYLKWIEERENSRKGMKKGLRNVYNAAFKKFTDVHHMKICNIRHADLQEIINSNSDMSKSTIYNMMTVCHEIAGYAIKNEYISTDFSKYLTGEFCDSEQIHKPFTHDEIDRLRRDCGMDGAQFALITIYTGMRPSELLQAVFTDEDLARGYIVAGLKTDAGKNRVIPLHADIIPIIRGRLLQSADGHLFRPLSLGAFRTRVWNPYFESVAMDHLPDDGRHTCATLMESADIPMNRRKLILGHALRDVTDAVYTHVPPEALVSEIQKIKP
jgi:integrase